MLVQNTDSIHDLQSLVTKLGDMLAASERRTARLERIVRLGVIGVASALGLALLISLKPFAYAVAQQEMPPSRSTEEAIDRLNMNLSRGLQQFGGMAGQMNRMFEMAMNGAVRAIEEEEMMTGGFFAKLKEKYPQEYTAWDEEKRGGKEFGQDALKFESLYKTQASPLAGYIQTSTLGLCRRAQQSPADNQPGGESEAEEQPLPMSMQDFCEMYENSYLKAFYKGKRPDVSKEFLAMRDKIYQAQFIGSMGAFAADVGVLMARFRQDSDKLREIVNKIGGPNELLNGIKLELHAMNGMLRAIPVMANRMDAMTAQMGVMSHSMGSSLGRAASWMPW